MFKKFSKLADYLPPSLQGFLLYYCCNVGKIGELSLAFRLFIISPLVCSGTSFHRKESPGKNHIGKQNKDCNIESPIPSVILVSGFFLFLFLNSNRSYFLDSPHRKNVAPSAKNVQNCQSVVLPVCVQHNNLN